MFARYSKHLGTAAFVVLVFVILVYNFFVVVPPLSTFNIYSIYPFAGILSNAIHAAIASNGNGPLYLWYVDPGATPESIAYYVSGGFNYTDGSGYYGIWQTNVAFQFLAGYNSNMHINYTAGNTCNNSLPNQYLVIIYYGEPDNYSYSALEAARWLNITCTRMSFVGTYGSYANSTEYILSLYKIK